MPNRKNILIVDDSSINRRILNSILAPDYNICEASDGQQALDILSHSTKDISLIILDVVMPVMDGYAFLQHYNNDVNMQGIPVIVTTTQDNEQDEIKALSAGAIDFISKPYKSLVIKHRVASILRMVENSNLISIFKMDAVTNIYTSEYFYRIAQALIRENPATKFDIICFDIRNFKLINDMYGSNLADDLLRHVAKIIDHDVSLSHYCGRIGADVFAALIPHQQDYNAYNFKSLETKLKQFPIDFDLTLKCGIYQIIDPTTSIVTMCDRAKLAISSIKDKYGVVYCIYDDSFRQSLLNEQFLTNHMEQAINNKEFKVYFQPKYSIKNGKIVGAEALSRWESPTKGLLSPGEFIPFFEKNGFITKLDLYMLEETCILLKKWRDEGKPIVPCSVNISRTDIFIPGIANKIYSIVSQYGLSPDLLHLEITENVYADDPNQMITIVNQLKSLGFIIEMDDFGSGYSSLNMLSVLPIDVLKLDIKFIQNSTQAVGKNILSFIISLARWLNLSVIAEGVETESQLKTLRKMDCNIVQGFYFSRPIAENEYAKLLTGDNVQFNELGNLQDVQMFASASNNPFIRKPTMMIVDDMELNRGILKLTFIEKFNIVEAENGNEALNYLETHPDEVDIMLLDLIMPQVDGLQVLTQIKSDVRLNRIPVIITSQAGNEGETKALELGADDYVAKPYNVQALIRRVTNVITNTRIKEASMDESKQILLHTAYHDFITGLYNRSGLDKAISTKLQEVGTLCSMYIIDVDDFKSINDKYGHRQGDSVLCQFGSLLSNLFRADDIIARYGGDEFLVILQNIPNKEFTAKRGKMICDSCQEMDFKITCSIGAITFKNGSESFENLFTLADKALYLAKENGKNCCIEGN